MIIDLIYRRHDLLACSLTCYSWYIAILPRLHHTLIISTGPAWKLKMVWPKPLQEKHKLGLLPFVKRLLIHGDNSLHSKEFSPQLFNCCILRHFFTLTNVQELGIDYLNIPKFMPRIRRYFGHFLPTVHSLTLRAPKGSCRQILYFIGLFPHLEDLKLLYNRADSQDEPMGDLTPTPPSAPPLRGRLTMTRSARARLFKGNPVPLHGSL